jgi:hypothetical protein
MRGSRDTEAAFDGFMEVLKKSLKRVALRSASGNRGDLGPITAFFGRVDEDDEVHGFMHL